MGRLADIADGASRGFPPSPGGFVGLFAVRRGEEVRVYVNSCPHVGVALDWMPDQFLTADRTRIVCSTHGALFAIEDGRCLAGPCEGLALERVPAEVLDGEILVPIGAGL